MLHMQTESPAEQGSRPSTAKPFGIAIIVDLEGCAGITRFKETYDRSDDFEMARRRMTAETNAAVEGAIAGGADAERIFAIDIHWDGRSLLPDELHKDCQLLRGGRFPSSRIQVYKQVDALAYLGMYGPSGAPGVLAHTYDFHVQYLTVNGERWGDADVECLLAGSMIRGAVPILGAGDQHALAAFQVRYPYVSGVQTKRAIDASSAICPHPERVNQAIREKMTVACSKFSADRSAFGRNLYLSATTPTEVVVAFATSEMADAVASLLPNVTRGTGHEVRRSFAPNDDTPLDLANFLACAVMLARASDDGRGGSDA
jgi:D-amino peptidase